MSERCVIEINECPEHRTKMLSVGDGNGSTRFAGPKCCGRWLVVQEFDMTPEALREAVMEFEAEVERLEDAS